MQRHGRLICVWKIRRTLLSSKNAFVPYGASDSNHSEVQLRMGRISQQVSHSI